MYIRYVNQNVNLEMLMTEIRSFFEQRGLSLEQHSEDGKYILIAKVRGFSKVIRIIVEGSPQNFVVEGTFVEGQPLHGFLSMFGGGAFLLQEIKLHERLSNLEKEFSTHLENLVIKMRNSDASGNLH